VSHNGAAQLSIECQELDMKAKLAQFWNDEDGITALEYGLIAGLMAVAIIAAIGFFTGGLTSLFTDLGAKLTSQGGAV
jgi:pilus assembly protein Flp/PilA